MIIVLSSMSIKWIVMHIPTILTTTSILLIILVSIKIFKHIKINLLLTILMFNSYLLTTNGRL